MIYMHACAFHTKREKFIFYRINKCTDLGYKISYRLFCYLNNIAKTYDSPIHNNIELQC